MAKKELLIIADYSEQSSFTFDELCEICGIQEELLQDLILNDIVKPINEEQAQWVFDVLQLRRIKTTLRLQHDLEVNLAGAALVLDLLEEIERLRNKAEILEKHLLKDF